LDCLNSRKEAQLLNYLKATGMKVGLLINFGSEKDLEWKRMTYTKPLKPTKNIHNNPISSHTKNYS